MKAILAFILTLMALAALGLTVYGAYLAFSASVILGLLVLIVEPAPFVLGLLAVMGHTDVAQRIAELIGLK